MAYLPRMSNKIGGFSVKSGLHRRYWSDMVADLWTVDCAPEAGGYYLGADPRLFIVLEAKGAENADLKMQEMGGKTISGCGIVAAHFIPAGLEMTTCLHGYDSLTHLDLHFDSDSLLRRLGDDVDVSQLNHPRYLLNDPRILTIAGLIADELRSAEPLHDLYGDGLVSALLMQVLKIRPPVLRKRSNLANWQMKRATDFIADHCLRIIRLEELADLVGLSPAYFSQAFKESLGLSPHQYQMKMRLEKVKDQLRNPRLPLTMIAAETGFADAAHFARSFRRAVGMTPSQWRRQYSD